jgi:sugar lactone lactonase YvrE
MSMEETTNRAITSLSPRAGVEGGEILVSCNGYDTSVPAQCHVWLGNEEGRLISASPTTVVASIPELPLGEAGEGIRLVDGRGAISAPFLLGRKLAEQLHPVGNPAIDPEDNSIVVTLSGSRGQRVPTSLFRISPDGVVTPLDAEVVNPTGLAFSPDGDLYVTSRLDGTLLRITPFGEVQTIASDLGVATGLAIAPRGEIYVGDRNGRILRVNELGESRVIATIEPSVSAFHLAIGPDGALYVTGPTVSSYESIYRIDLVAQEIRGAGPLGLPSPLPFEGGSEARVTRFFTGLGRPQGLAFDQQGNLYVAASLRGHRGIIRIAPQGQDAEVIVAGGSLVGLAFDRNGNMIVTSTERVYSLAWGIAGR